MTGRGLPIEWHGASGTERGPLIESAITCVLFAAGLALVVKGGELFVRGSVGVAAHARMPQVVVGATLLSLVTAAPELAVAVAASLRGCPGLAVGSVVGAAIANIGLVLGVLCVLRPMAVRPREFRLPAFAMLGAGVLLGCLTWRLWIGRAAGLLLLGCGLVYLLADVLRSCLRAEAVGDRQPPATSRGRAIGAFAMGAALLVLGSWLVCDSAVRLARDVLGVPPIIVGLTLVAFGTSLPKLLTAIAAARRAGPELSLGNVLGANILAITLVAGTAAAIGPLPLTRRIQLYSLPAMVVLFVLLLVLAWPVRRLTRKEGWALVCFYAVYLAGLILIRE